MGLNASKIKNESAGGSAQEPLEAGVYPGRLVQLIDMGLQPQHPFQGKDKPPCQEVMLTYELTDEFMQDEEGNDIEDKPRWISETLPFYGLRADKSKAVKRLNAFDPTGDFEGDFVKAINIPVNITLVQNVKGDKTYVNVANIASMRSRDADGCAELKNPSKVFDLDAPDLDVFNSFPDWIQEKIKSNLNYQGSILSDLMETKAPAPKKEKKSRKPVEDKEDEAEEDDTPY